MMGDKRKEIERILRLNIPNSQFSVERLAEGLKVSVSHLREIVELEYGSGPQWLIETTRLKASLGLIANGGGNLYSICKEVGYQNMRTFRRAFEKRLDMTPSECRKFFLDDARQEKTLRRLVEKLHRRENVR